MRTIAATLPGVLAAAGTALAGTLGVAPIRVELGPTAGVAVLTVRNQDDAPVVVQARPAAWSQHDGQEQLEDTHELLVTPPLFTIPARSEQVVRVALLRKPDPARELDYRLVLSEVPPEAAPEPGQLRVALRITLPVFVAAAVRGAPELSWHHSVLPDGTLRIVAENRGRAHIQVLNFDASPAEGGGEQLHTDNARYLLPGASAQWELRAAPGTRGDARVLIRGHSDAGDFSVTSEPSGP
jgi:fimbrial chaperone protein